MGDRVGRGLTNLTSLSIQQCNHLERLPDGISYLKELQQLSLAGSSKLSSPLPPFYYLLGLTKLDMSNCESLTHLPELRAPTSCNAGDPTTSMLWRLKCLDLSHCTSLLSADLSGMSGLTELKVMGCLSLTSLSLSSCTHFDGVTGCVSDLPALQVLDVSYRPQGELMLHHHHGLKTLKARGCQFLNLVDVSSCTALTCFEFSESGAHDGLNLSGCSSLVRLPADTFGRLCIFLSALQLRDCCSLVELPSSFSSLPNLTILDLSGCSSIIRLPSLPCTTLVELQLGGCSSLAYLPSLGHLARLTKMCVQDCSKLVALPDDIGRLKKLLVLDASHCYGLEMLPTSLCSSLTCLDLSGCQRLPAFAEALAAMAGGMPNVRVCLQGWAPWEEITADIQASGGSGSRLCFCRTSKSACCEPPRLRSC